MVLPRADQEEQLLNLYGFSFFHPEDSRPIFGSNIEKPLSNGWETYIQNAVSDEEGQLAEEYHPQTTARRLTLRNLTHHFGYMEPVEDLLTHLIRMSHGRITGKDLSQIIGPLEIRAQQRFVTKVVQPTREDLLLQDDYACYLYCVPSISNETDVLTGKPIYERGAAVLTLLPVHEQSALLLQANEAEMALIARQVLHIVLKRCSNKTIRTAEELHRALNGWPEQVNDPLSLQRMRRIVEDNYPYLMTTEIKALLSS